MRATNKDLSLPPILSIFGLSEDVMRSIYMLAVVCALHSAKQSHLTGIGYTCLAVISAFGCVYLIEKLARYIGDAF
jgi:hypothetical protein